MNLEFGVVVVVVLNVALEVCLGDIVEGVEEEEVAVVLDETLVVAEDTVEGVGEVGDVEERDGKVALHLIGGFGLTWSSSRIALDTYLSWPVNSRIICKPSVCR